MAHYKAVNTKKSKHTAMRSMVSVDRLLHSTLKQFSWHTRVHIKMGERLHIYLYVHTQSLNRAIKASKTLYYFYHHCELVRAVKFSTWHMSRFKASECSSLQLCIGPNIWINADISFSPHIYYFPLLIWTSHIPLFYKHAHHPINL